jgi:hypothetical protein
MAWGNLARAFLDLVFGRNVGRGGPTASSARDAIMNGKPLPTASIVNNEGLPVATQLSSAAPGGLIKHRVGRYTSAQTSAPVGDWVSFQSTWILKARFDFYPNQEERDDIPNNSRRGALYVQFLSYAMVEYHNVPVGIWQLLYGAPSKGRFLHQAALKRRDPWTQGYTVIQPATRKVTLAMRQANG